MKQVVSSRGFQFVNSPTYLNGEETDRLVSQSSAVGECLEPGASYVWIGDHHHLDRDEVLKLIAYLEKWVETGKLWTVLP